ncbi:hypothetical protein BDZ89DRAFT_1044398 [Hymenopellis radicata]|nr:hypothetical protein BDZ89DRAFT_1044398 [Hymenopellis radicata]
MARQQELPRMLARQRKRIVVTCEHEHQKYERRRRPALALVGRQASFGIAESGVIHELNRTYIEEYAPARRRGRQQCDDGEDADCHETSIRDSALPLNGHEAHHRTANGQRPRTEFFDGTQDIFYSWQSPGLPPTSRTKLTTWRQETTYKELVVPLPGGTREGQTWRLILSTGDAAVNLADVKQLGKTPFGVLSMPINISRSNNGKKQEQIERVYTLGATGKMKITEQTSFDLDKKIWDSGVGLSSWLVNGLQKKTLPPALDHVLFSTESAGTGIVSLTIAALRHSLLEGAEDGESRIVTTDLDSAMPLLEHNISSNKHLFPTPSASPQAALLDWNEDLPDLGVAAFDAIVMADVTYNTASFPALVATLVRLVNACPNPPVILLGYKQRDEAERTLWTMTKEYGIEFRQLDEVAGAGGAPIEVWIAGNACHSHRYLALIRSITDRIDARTWAGSLPAAGDCSTDCAHNEAMPPEVYPSLPRALPSRHVGAQPTHFRGFSESAKSAHPSNAFNPGDPTTWFKPTTPPPASWSSDWSQPDGKSIHRELVRGDRFNFCYGFNDQMVQPLAFSAEWPPSPVFLFVYKEEYYFYNDILLRFPGPFASHEDFLSQFKGNDQLVEYMRPKDSESRDWAPGGYLADIILDLYDQETSEFTLLFSGIKALRLVCIVSDMRHDGPSYYRHRYSTGSFLAPQEQKPLRSGEFKGTYCKGRLPQSNKLPPFPGFKSKAEEICRGVLDNSPKRLSPCPLSLNKTGSRKTTPRTQRRAL